MLNGKKVCGILIEQGRGTVVGIGMNVQQTPQEFEAAGLVATSLNQSASQALSTHDVARALLEVLDDEYVLLCRGELSPLVTSWQQYLNLLGKSVVAERRSRVYRGRLRTLDFDFLELELADQSRLALRPEEVQHLFSL
jgi:biotin-(acetyl-CoA carboxylase) ligase